MIKFILYKQLSLSNSKKYKDEISKFESNVQHNEVNIINQIILTDCSNPQVFNNKLESFGQQVYCKQNKNIKLSTDERENICKLISVNHNIQIQTSNLSKDITDSISNKNNIWIYKPNESEELNNYLYPWLHYFYEVLVYDDKLPSIPIDNLTVEPPRISLSNDPAVKPPSLSLTYNVDEIIDTLTTLYFADKPCTQNDDSSDTDEEPKIEFVDRIEELLKELRNKKNQIKLNESLKSNFEAIKSNSEKLTAQSFIPFLEALLETTKRS